MRAADTLDESGFLDYLRLRGFSIGTDQYVRVFRVISTLQDGTPVIRFRTLLAPVIARSGEEQSRFYSAFDEYFACKISTTQRSVLLEQHQPAEAAGFPGPPSAKVRQRPRFPASLKWVLAAILVVVTSAMFLVEWPKEREITPQPESRNNSEPVTDRNSRGLRAVDMYIRSELLPWLKWVVALTVAALAIGHARRARAGLVASREGRLASRGDIPLPKTIYTPAAVRAAATALRRRLSGEQVQFDPEASVNAALTQPHSLALRFRNVPKTPEYIVLVDRSSLGDHLASLFETLASLFAQERVHALTYLFGDASHVCVDAVTGMQIPLAEIRRAWPQSRPMVFTTGERFIDARTGDLSAWTRHFAEWNMPLLYTPGTRLHRQVVLARVFHVWPATLKGVLASIEGRSSGRGGVRAMLPRHQSELEPITPDEIASFLQHLQPRVRRWLAACAVYPSLHWDLTLHLGAQVLGDVSEEEAIRLFRIRWFRDGHIPEPLRRALLACVPAEQRLADVSLGA